MDGKDEFCSGVIPTSDYRDDDIRVCVYENPETGAQLLHTDGDFDTDFIVFRNEVLVGVFSDQASDGIPELAPGDYEVLIFYNSLELMGKVNFTFSDPPEPVVFHTEILTQGAPNDFTRLTSDHATIARYLYRTERDNFCTGNIPTEGTEDHTRVCVFDDPITGAKILYVDEAEKSRMLLSASSGNFRFTELIVLHDGQIVGVLGGRGGRGILGFGIRRIRIACHLSFRTRPKEATHLPVWLSVIHLTGARRVIGDD